MDVSQSLSSTTLETVAGEVIVMSSLGYGWGTRENEPENIWAGDVEEGVLDGTD